MFDKHRMRTKKMHYTVLTGLASSYNNDNRNVHANQNR